MPYGFGKGHEPTPVPVFPVGTLVGFVDWALGEQGYRLVPPTHPDDVARLENRHGFVASLRIARGSNMILAKGWARDLAKQYLAHLETRVAPGRLKGPPLVELLRRAVYGRGD